MRIGEISNTLERLPVIPLEQYRIYGTAVGEVPPSVEVPSYRAWYLSNGKNRERHIWREILITLGGKCSFGWKNRVLTLETGAVFLLEKLEPHAFFYPREMRDVVHLWLVWPENEQEVVVSLIYDNGDRLVSVSLPRAPMIEEPYAKCLSLWKECFAAAQRGEKPDALLREKFKAYAVTSVLESISLPSSFIDEDQQNPERVVKTVMDFIDTHPENTLSLEKLAAIAGYSKYHFHRIFRETTGETIHSYTTRRKVAHAWGLLKHGYSCSAIAKEMGFASLSSFSRWFKEHAGVAPSHVQ